MCDLNTQVSKELKLWRSYADCTEPLNSSIFLHLKMMLKCVTFPEVRKLWDLSRVWEHETGCLSRCGWTGPNKSPDLFVHSKHKLLIFSQPLGGTRRRSIWFGAACVSVMCCCVRVHLRWPKQLVPPSQTSGYFRLWCRTDVPTPSERHRRLCVFVVWAACVSAQCVRRETFFWGGM